MVNSFVLNNLWHIQLRNRYYSCLYWLYFIESSYASRLSNS